MKTIYADNAATTAICDESLNAMTDCLKNVYGNPSSLHSVGQKAAEVIRESRAVFASELGCDENEIYFTSGGTEADNWALRSSAENAIKCGKKHIISTRFEHHAVLHTLKALEEKGFEVTYLDVHKNGIIDLAELKNAIRDDTALVTVMYANNEIGTIQPIAEIGELCGEKGIIFHTDAVQAAGHLRINVRKENIDMLSLSAHKFHGPKGVGVLYCKKWLKLNNLMYGGAQERGKRPTTENVAGIVGAVAAFKKSCAGIDENMSYVTALRNELIENIIKSVPKTRLNGDMLNRLPGNISFCFEGIEGESLILLLDQKGICASSGSACTSGSLDPSHVLLAIGLPHEIAHGSLRLSLCENNTKEEVEYISHELPRIVERLRNMSPVWEKIIREDDKNVIQ